MHGWRGPYGSVWRNFFVLTVTSAGNLFRRNWNLVYISVIRIVGVANCALQVKRVER
jgi:hypothetical protein